MMLVQHVGVVWNTWELFGTRGNYMEHVGIIWDM